MSVKERSDIFRDSISFRLFGRRQNSAVSASVGAKSATGMPAIPRFEFVRKLGEGGMASVYLARQAHTGRLVAIKIMASHLQSDSRWVGRFLDEGRRMAELSHPNIVPVFDWGTHDGISYIVMEYMKGGDLEHRLATLTISVREALDIVRQVALGLDFAGEKGCVHRDIKPENILFREDGSPCILDFGIAKEYASNTTMSSQGTAIGTGAYMSPEQAQPAGKEIDARSDLYSLGIILYQLLAGRRPFEFGQYEATQAFQMYLFAHIHSAPPPLQPALTMFQPIVDRLLAKNPDNRFARGNDLRMALVTLESCLTADLLGAPIRIHSPPSELASSVNTAALHEMTIYPDERLLEKAVRADSKIYSGAAPVADDAGRPITAGRQIAGRSGARAAWILAATTVFAGLIAGVIRPELNWLNPSKTETMPSTADNVLNHMPAAGLQTPALATIPEFKAATTLPRTTDVQEPPVPPPPIVSVTKPAARTTSIKQKQVVATLNQAKPSVVPVERQNPLVPSARVDSLELKSEEVGKSAAGATGPELHTRLPTEAVQTFEAQPEAAMKPAAKNESSVKASNFSTF